MEKEEGAMEKEGQRDDKRLRSGERGGDLEKGR